MITFFEKNLNMKNCWSRFQPSYKGAIFALMVFASYFSCFSADNCVDSSSSDDYVIIPCSVCSGVGKAKAMCWGCAGLGFKYMLVSDYYTGVRSVPVTCSDCGGGGSTIQRCGFCGGAGEIKLPKSMGNSSGGGYNGGYNNGGGYSNSGGSSRTTCSRCHGSGVCKSCGGSGGKYQYVDDYTGSGARSFINCGECNGGRKCPICYGRGSL